MAQWIRRWSTKPEILGSIPSEVGLFFFIHFLDTYTTSYLFMQRGTHSVRILTFKCLQKINKLLTPNGLMSNKATSHTYI